MSYRVLCGIAMMLCLSLISTNANAPLALEPQQVINPIDPLRPTEADVLANWQFDEGDGQETADSSGNGFHATLGPYGSTNWQDPSWVSGHRGKALDFDGSNDFVNAGRPGPITNAVSVTAWIRPDSLGKREVLAKGNAGSPSVGDFGLRIQDGSGHVSARTRTASGWMEVISTATVQVGDWTHLAMVADTSGLRVYINRVRDPVTPGIIASFNASNPNKTYIGAHPAPNTYPYDNPVNAFDGLIDDVQIWNAALSDSEISRVYNDSLPKLTRPTPQPFRAGVWGKLEYKDDSSADNGQCWHWDAGKFVMRTCSQVGSYWRFVVFGTNGAWYSLQYRPNPAGYEEGSCVSLPYGKLGVDGQPQLKACYIQETWNGSRNYWFLIPAEPSVCDEPSGGECMWNYLAYEHPYRCLARNGATDTWRLRNMLVPNWLKKSHDQEGDGFTPGFYGDCRESTTPTFPRPTGTKIRGYWRFQPEA